MSEEWKNNRMEADIRQHEAELIKIASERLKKQQFTGEWKITITASGINAEQTINEFIAALSKLEKDFTGDDVTTEIDQVIKIKKNDN